MSNNKRLIMIITLFVLIPSVTGFGRKEIRLFYGDKKLIDLSAAIKTEPIGPEGRDDSGKENTVSDNNSPTVLVNRVPMDDSLNITIAVRGQVITLDDKEITMTEMKSFIIRNKNKVKSCKLIDDFADAETYKDVDRMLIDLGIEPDYEES